MSSATVEMWMVALWRMENRQRRCFRPQIDQASGEVFQARTNLAGLGNVARRP